MWHGYLYSSSNDNSKVRAKVAIIQSKKKVDFGMKPQC